MSRTNPIALALAAALLVVGCGSSSSTLTRSQLIAKAEPICAAENAKLAAVLTAKSPGDISRTAAEFSRYERQASAALSKFAPPSSMANDWKAIVTGYQTAGSAIETLGQTAAKKAKPSNAAVAEFSNAQQSRMSAATRAGFKECAKG